MVTRECRAAMAAAQGRLDNAAAVHIAHRHICRQRDCAECKSLARTVLRHQQQVGLMRFDRADPEDF